MIAFDTNLLVRLAVNDDPNQAEIAEHLLDTQQVFVPRTVLLETEWVLRSVYKKPRTEISDFIDKALITTNLIVENSSEVANALEWYRLGADFADAMHLCMCGEARIHTFDADFCKAAKESGFTPAFEVLIA
uniref:Predicted nucleic-acid-binding protein, contains PIN domain n=1 Tax=Candidatus Kentrum sp. SD TaxID=2126332 RepID=A0A450YLB3_9GAMM|nr:MAG: Predicted nucleic-acid-binding protein, contains PIN domain [Candidatus Kentron sp. SD]VFK42299.1 MAG: Predicted nucleic-acid-binding protein, contains PIN domain [Candidatus Kentron sp. SD]